MRKVLSVLFLLSCLHSASGQTPYFQDYLPLKKRQAVQVNNFLQTREGYLWLGTDHGLFRFDGSNFLQFNSDNGLPDENVTALAEDSVGRIWLGHKSGKISIVERLKVKPFEPAEGLPSQPISDILFDKKGILWFGTRNDGLYYFTNNRLYRLDDAEGMPDTFIYDLTEDADGNIWAGTDGGIAICSFEKNEIKIKTISSAQGLPDNIVKKLLMGKNNWWLVTEDAGVISYDSKNRQFKKVSASWGFGKPIDVLELNDELWIATDRDLLSISIGKFEFKSFRNEGITSLFKDNEENLWLGRKNGITRTTAGRVQFIQDADKSIDVLAVATDQQNIWFSTPDGLFKRNSAGQIQKHLNNTRFSKSSAASLYVDDEGIVWAGLYDEGLLRIRPTGEVKQIKEGLGNGSILNISGKKGSLWLATLGGASHLKFQDGKMEIKNYSSQNGLSTDYIYQVFEDSKGRVWFATDRAGIDMLDQNGFHHFKGAIDQKVIYGFAEDSEHNLWANVHGLGLYFFDGKDFVAFQKQNSLRETNINCLTTNLGGELVIAHDQGIDIYDPKSKSIQYLGEELGIEDQTPNLNATAKDSNGRIYLGTTDGILLLSGKSYQNKKPKAVIEGLDIYNQSLSPTHSLRLSYNQNSISIHFAGLWFQSPDNINYQLTLENHDESWFSTKNSSQSYSQLPPGDYVFHVKVSETNDFENADEAKVRISISPPFWRTGAFFMIMLALIIFIFFSVVKWREKKLKAEKLELENIIYERTMEIEANAEEIKAQAEEIQGINENLEAMVHERTAELERKNKALEEYAFINAHQLRAPVASILGLVNLMKSMPLSEAEKDCLDHLVVSSKKLDDVVNSITQAIERGDYGTFIPPDSSELTE